MSTPARKPPHDNTPDAEARWLAALDASIRAASKRTAKGERRPAPAPPQPLLLDAGPHPATLDPQMLRAQCALTKGRTSGPGGQHRNKVETSVELLHQPTGIAGQASERRTVTENMRMALWRLRHALALRVRCPVPAGEVRSALWLSRCRPAGPRAGRIVLSPEHDDFPAMLAEALDVLWAAGLDVPTAALRLGCTGSQLVKLLKDYPPALVLVNAHRLHAGEHALK